MSKQETVDQDSKSNQEKRPLRTTELEHIIGGTGTGSEEPEEDPNPISDEFSPIGKSGKSGQP